MKKYNPAKYYSAREIMEILGIPKATVTYYLRSIPVRKKRKDANERLGPRTVQAYEGRVIGKIRDRVFGSKLRVS